ncbi:Uncharacterised protein [Vibrio cholerae]|nr:Uncharacterised protein [Vibrio cholerae]
MSQGQIFWAHTWVDAQSFQCFRFSQTFITVTHRFTALVKAFTYHAI